MHLVCSGGITQLSRLTEDDPAKLYVPENTKAEQDDVKIKASFGLGERIAHVYATTNPDGSNILTTENVLTVGQPALLDPPHLLSTNSPLLSSYMCFFDYTQKLKQFCLTASAVRCLGQRHNIHLRPRR